VVAVVAAELAGRGKKWGQTKKAADRQEEEEEEEEVSTK
jgi:hypothetical protein